MAISKLAFDASLQKYEARAEALLAELRTGDDSTRRRFKREHLRYQISPWKRWMWATSISLTLNW